MKSDGAFKLLKLSKRKTSAIPSKVALFHLARAAAMQRNGERDLQRTTGTVPEAALD